MSGTGAENLAWSCRKSHTTKISFSSLLCFIRSGIIGRPALGPLSSPNPSDPFVHTHPTEACILIYKRGFKRQTEAFKGIEGKCGSMERREINSCAIVFRRSVLAPKSCPSVGSISEAINSNELRACSRGHVDDVCLIVPRCRTQDSCRSLNLYFVFFSIFVPKKA